MLRFALSLVLLAIPAFAGVTYTVTDITSAIESAGAGGFGQAISSNGIVAGVVTSPCTQGQCAFIDNNGTVTHFGTGVSDVTGVNNLGQVSGDYYPTGSSILTAFRSTGTSITALTDPIVSGGLAQSLGIDNAGDVLGLVLDNSTTKADELILWLAGGGYTDLGAWDGSAAIGANGQVAGATSTGGFLLQNGVKTNFTGSGLTVTGVSSAGQVTGHYGSPTDTFLTNGSGAVQNLGAGQGSANSYVNASGTVAAGTFVYTSGVWTNLNSLLSGFSNVGFAGIADSGVILATGTGASNVTHTLLLTPSGTTPEPATGLVVLAALSALLICKKTSAQA